MRTVRYIMCGAATGYLLLAEAAGLLLDNVGVTGLVVIPAGLIGGGFCGLLYGKTKRARHDRVVPLLPERADDSARAAA